MRQALLGMLLLMALGAGCHANPPVVGDGVYALRYGLSKFPEKFVRQPARTGMVNFGWYVFAIRDDAGWTVVDTGPAAERPEVPWRIRQEESVPDLLAQLGCREVQRVILTHAHWDHAGGLSAFPRARVWLARSEYQEMKRLLAGGPWVKAYRQGELQALERVEAEGRLELFDKEAQVTPTVRVFAVGGHTVGMLAVLYAPQGQARLMLAGDNAYLERNLQDGQPIAPISRHGPDALPAIRRLAGQAPLIPGHEPDLLERYPLVTPRIARLYPPQEEP